MRFLGKSFIPPFYTRGLTSDPPPLGRPEPTRHPNLQEVIRKAGMVGLKGHRLTGGIRVSAHNAISERDVATLVDFKKSFARAKG